MNRLIEYALIVALAMGLGLGTIQPILRQVANVITVTTGALRNVSQQGDGR